MISSGNKTGIRLTFDRKRRRQEENRLVLIFLWVEVRTVMEGAKRGFDGIGAEDVSIVHHLVGTGKRRTHPVNLELAALLRGPSGPSPGRNDITCSQVHALQIWGQLDTSVSNSNNSTLTWISVPALLATSPFSPLPLPDGALPHLNRPPSSPPTLAPSNPSPATCE